MVYVLPNTFCSREQVYVCVNSKCVNHLCTVKSYCAIHSLFLQLDGLSVAQMKELRDGAEKHHFEAEVNRMMKLIINSLYRNKEVKTSYA